jgi:hypothetical protein
MVDKFKNTSLKLSNEIENKQQNRDEDLYKLMEKDLTQNLDLNHSFDFDIDEEVGGVNHHNEESKATDNEILKMPWNTQEKSLRHNMHESFTKDQVAHGIHNIRIETEGIELNNKDNKTKRKINYYN